MNINEVVLVITLFAVSYSYFIYPLILLALPKQTYVTSHSRIINNYELPFITLIITAYNEAARIKEKITNTLEIDYPANKREILVASDGSTDETNAYAEEFAPQGVRLIKVQERKGKENAQLAAISESKGEILIFSDVATHIPAEAIQTMVSAFSNTRIGAISSEDRFITEDGRIAGEGAYVKYEMWLRRLEARVKSLVGLSGSFFACRKNICDTWDINVPSDFNTALNCVSHGYVAISHPDVLGYYPNLKDESKEYQRKLRTVIRGMAAIAHNPSVLNTFKYGLFAFQVFSHKIMRWLVPWFMLVLLFISMLVWQQHFMYTVILIGQILFYTLALIGYMSKTSQNTNLIKIPFFFMQVNIAIAHAGLLFILGRRITQWEPSKRR